MKMMSVFDFLVFDIVSVRVLFFLIFCEHIVSS